MIRGERHRRAFGFGRITDSTIAGAKDGGFGATLPLPRKGLDGTGSVGAFPLPFHKEVSLFVDRHDGGAADVAGRVIG